jgi:putative phosphoribosyl transferase
VSGGDGMSRMPIFTDRSDAGRRLADRLAAMAFENALVLALPRGGVPVGAEIARRLGVPLDLVHVRKLGAPNQPELAIGAVADGEDPEVVVNSALAGELGVSEDFIVQEATQALEIIEKRRSTYVALPPLATAGRAVIVVDDGVATGMTMRAALRQLRRRRPSRIVAAAPVAAREAMRLMEADADEVVCLACPRQFGSVGAFYRSFTQVMDDDVVRLLRELRGEGA